MSEELPAEKKVIHRLEPKKRPVLLSKKTETRAELSELPRTINAQFFQETVDQQALVEDVWGKGTEQTRSRSYLLGGMAVLAIFFLGCVGWALLALNGAEKKPVLVQADTERKLSHEDLAELRHEVVRKYLAAKTVAEKAVYVRDSDRVYPLMEKHYEKYELDAEEAIVKIVEAPVMGKETVLWRMQVREFGSARSPYILVETLEDGTSLVDWETDVVYQPSDWSEFKQKRKTDPHLFRAHVQIAQLDGFHGFEFAEFNKFRCFKVTLPLSEDYLWAYTEVGSEVDKQMVSLVTAGGRRKSNTKKVLPVMLELRYPENSQSQRCVHLEKLVQAGWVY